MGHARPIPPEVVEAARERLPKCLPNGPASDCWEWPGSRDSKGYGKIKVLGREWRVTRLVLSVLGHDVAPELLVCHKCDNPPCVNPAHLFLGDDMRNTIDRLSKGRLLERRGSDNPRAAIDEDAVREIRASEDTYARLAQRYGVSYWTIRNIRQVRSWVHVQ